MKRKHVSALFTGLLTVVFIVGAVLTASRLIDYWITAKREERAHSMLAFGTSAETPEVIPSASAAPVESTAESTSASTTDTETTESTTEAPVTLMPDGAEVDLLSMDFSALQAENPDVFGWIMIPGTNVSYPLLRGEDNEEYLGRAWDRERSVSGSIFLECSNAMDFSDFNTLIYGHRMLNESMFGSLPRYEDAAYRDAHPVVYIITDTQVRGYTVFSAYESTVESDTYRVTFASDTEKQNALTYYLNSSVWDSDIPVSTDDSILTLSTCTSTASRVKRWVVQAKLTDIWER